MKIKIELEVSPEEVSLATELVATLRNLTSHVSVKQTSSAPGAPGMFQNKDPSVQPLPFQPGPKVSAPAVGAATTAGVGSALGGLSLSPAPISGPEAFSPLINRLLDVPNLDPAAGQQLLEQVGMEIKSVFERSPSSREDLVSFFLQAFGGIVFSPELVKRQQPLLPFMELLPMLPDTAYPNVRDKLISAVLKHLTMKRSLEADRAEFFAYAEAFAALVKLGTVSISGSVTTIITLMNKPENRCAAVTMLGKTCELCGDLLVEKCTEAELTKLRGAVDMLASEPNSTFQYDVEYVVSIMGWSN